MSNKSYLRLFLSLTLLFSVSTVSLPVAGYAQTSAAQTQPSTDLQKGLRAIEERVEKRRQELGVPGVSLVIVKDGEPVLMKGFGYKNFEDKIAVTPDTQFAIGSATKAFTALSVLMSADEGKINLDDSPKKYLPYFKMYDAETDKNMTVRDLMTHSSGLNRTDLAMITGRLTRRELIQVAGEAKPMAKLREKWFYQNIMFAAAGETVAQVQKTTWEKFIPERIFKPLGMTNSTMSMAEMQKVKDYSFGYEYNFDTKETRRLPFREIQEVAPAGSINSSARDMARWLAFVLDGGSANGKRLVSEKNFDEWTKKQMNITPDGKIGYGLGWFVRSWNGLKVVEHGGNIDGFTTLVGMLPEKKVGFAVMINASNSPLGGELMPFIWENTVGNPNAVKTDNQTAVGPEKEAGKYSIAGTPLTIEVKMQDGKLVALAPNQPTYTLENVGGRKYKLSGAPEGFFITFKDTEAFLEQPQGNHTLQKAGAETNPQNTEALKELIGKYQSEAGSLIVEIKEVDGKIALVVEGQQPYVLVEREKDVYRTVPLPDDYALKIKRAADGKISNIVLSQPQGEPSFKRLEANAVNTPKIAADELMAKAIEAVGGEANWRKLSSRVTVADIDLMNQGVKGTATSYAKAPNLSASETTMTALGKTIAKGFEFFDGKGGEELYTFAPVERFTGKKLEDIRLGADFYSMLNWKTNYKTVEVKGTEKCGDGEECYVVDLVPEKGTKVTDYYSTKTFLLVKRRGVSVSSTSQNSIPYTVTFSDYREVDGVRLPFKTVSTNPAMGEIVTIVKSVKHNVPVDDKMFAPREVKFD